MLGTLVFVSAALLGLDAVQIHDARRGTFPRIKVYVMKTHKNDAYNTCMRHQVARLADTASKLGGFVKFDAIDTPTFAACTDAASCIKEKPDCFPTQQMAFVDMGFSERQAGKTDKMREAASSWCGRLKAFRAMKKERNNETITPFDLYLVLDDDVVLKDSFYDKLMSFYQDYPYHWSLVGIDTEAHWLPELPKEDLFAKTSDYELYSMSGSMNAYWNGRAWLVNGAFVNDLADFHETIPASSMNLFTKIKHSSSLAMWSLQAGMVKPEPLTEGKIDETEGCHEVNADPAQITQFLSKGRHMLLKSATPSESGEAREVVVLGMPGASHWVVTDLIKEGLEKPFGVKLCQRTTEDNECGPVRAHIHPDRLMGEQAENLDKAVAVVVVRHPLATSHALMSDRPIISCGNETALSGLMRSGNYWPPFANPKLIEGHTELSEQDSDISSYCWWQSTTEAWTSYADGYKKLGNQFSKVVTVRLEDAVNNPDVVLKQIASATGVAVPKETPDQSQYVPEDYTDEYEMPPCEEMYVLCANLKKPLMFELGYHFCQKVWSAYDELLNNAVVYQDLLRPMDSLMHSWPESFPCKMRSTQK